MLKSTNNIHGNLIEQCSKTLNVDIPTDDENNELIKSQEKTDSDVLRINAYRTKRNFSLNKLKLHHVAITEKTKGLNITCIK